MLIVETML